MKTCMCIEVLQRQVVNFLLCMFGTQALGQALNERGFNLRDPLLFVVEHVLYLPPLLSISFSCSPSSPTNSPRAVFLSLLGRRS